MKILTKKSQQYIESKRDRIMNVIIKYACKDPEIDQAIENLYDISNECGVYSQVNWIDRPWEKYLREGSGYNEKM